MEEEKRYSECSLYVFLAIGLAAGVIAGMAIYAAAYPAFQSSEWAAWVQAIGSVAAIAVSAWIGKKQAQTALEIHIRDVRERNRKLQTQLDRQQKIESAKDKEDKENALAEAAVHRVAMKRIDRDIVGLHVDIEDIVRSIESERSALSEYEKRRSAAQLLCNFDELRRIGCDIDITRGHLSRHESRLAEYAVKLEGVIEKLGELPRSVIRVASEKLAYSITSAINNLQSAALEMEHVKIGRTITQSISAADYDLREYFRELDSLLNERLLATCIQSVPTPTVSSAPPPAPASPPAIQARSGHSLAGIL
ncbi:hypothetical protein [Castellaniella sp.]|uniref:hypothetical protein n=1 Tax=Castellaniella sp. TaxID=1955812 RepID=UPI003C789865